jgi:hypothetical protein
MKRKLITYNDNYKKDKFFFCTSKIYVLLFLILIVMKLSYNDISEDLKEKDFILMEPFLTYFGESLFFFFDLIYQNISYTEDYDNTISKKNYIYIGIICLLLLIIDIYRIFILICFKLFSFASSIMIFSSWILLIQFSILISFCYFKTRVYKHHKLVIYIYTLYEIYIFFMVFLTGKTYEYILLFIQIVISFIESITIILIKYIMEKKFFSPYKVCYLIGFFNIIISFIILIIFANIKCYNDFISCQGDEYIFDFSFIRNTKFLYILIYFFFISLFSGTIKYLINTILKRYTIFHISFFYQCNLLEYNFIILKYSNIINNNTISMIILFAHNIFSLFGVFLNQIFLEIIELNFCNLSDNIKKSIQDRGDEEFNDLLDNNKEKLKMDDVSSSNYEEKVDSDSEIDQKELNE